MTALATRQTALPTLTEAARAYAESARSARIVCAYEEAFVAFSHVGRCARSG
jgi:hypothetical protein